MLTQNYALSTNCMYILNIIVHNIKWNTADYFFKGATQLELYGFLCYLFLQLDYINYK